MAIASSSIFCFCQQNILPKFSSSSSSSSSSSAAAARFPIFKCLPSSSFTTGNFSVISITPSAPVWRHRIFFPAPRSSPTDVKEVVEEQEADVIYSDTETSDNGNDGVVSEEESSIDSLLKEYKASILSGVEASIAEIESKFISYEKEKDVNANRMSSLIEESTLLKDRLLRLNADFENFRKRSERERLAVASNVKGDVVNSLLPMVDNFERAKTQIKIETEGEQKIDSSYQGIYKQFVEIMKGLGVSAVETVGKQFDPNIHEAIMREESAQYPEGVVMEEFRRGFMLGDKLLRPAMVKVSSGLPSTPSEQSNAGEPELEDENVNK